MAGEDDPLKALRRALAALDDAALANLASTGLLRRARKDLEGGEPVTLADPAAVPLELAVAGCTVRISGAGPAAVTCTCPAPGTCRHVLMAVLYLQGGYLQDGLAEEPPSLETPASPACTFEEIARWAGKKDLSKARRVAPGALREPAGAPRTRAQVIAEARSLFEDMLDVGLSHLSAAFRQHLATLAVSSLGANLPRLSLALKGLAGEVELLLRRDARADEARLFLSMARAGALCAALGDGNGAPAGLVGEHRGRYEPAGTLELHGMGAYPWRTRSGHGGLTVLFWSPTSPTAGRWLTWSESRPRHATDRFSPAERYLAEGPWKGIGSPREASRTRFNLLGARVNGEGRLSAAESCQAVPLGPSRFLEIGEAGFGDRLFTRFEDLRRYAAAVHPVGLAERHAGDEVVVVRPAAWGPRGFDPILQAFRWVVMDEEGGTLRLEIPWDETGTPAVKALESVHPDRDGAWGVIGRVSWDGAGLALSPTALLRSKEPEIVSLGLDGFRGSARRSEPVEIPAEPLPPWLAQLESGVGRFEEELLRKAEAGRRTFGVPLAGMAADLEARGLPALAAAAGLPLRLLRARYLCELHRQAAVRLALTAPGDTPDRP